MVRLTGANERTVLPRDNNSPREKATIYKRKETAEKEKKTHGIYQPLSEEDKMKILSGGPSFTVAKVDLMFFSGVARNRSPSIKEFLRPEGISPNSIPHLGFSKSGILELFLKRRSHVQAPP